VNSATDDIAPPAGDDAPLVSLCGQLVAIEDRRTALLETCHTLAEEEAAADRVAALDEAASAITGALLGLRPTTLAEATALARAAMSVAARTPDGELRARDVPDALALRAVEWLAGPAGQDAAIIGAVEKLKPLCDRAEMLSRLVDDLPAGDPGRERLWAEIRELTAAGWQLRGELAQLRALSLEGLRAKAWAVREFSDVETGENFNPTDGAALAWSLAGDLLGLPPAQGKPA